MDKLEKNFKLIQRLSLLIILLGIIEIFTIIIFSDKYFLILVSLLTIIPAYSTYNNKYKKKSSLVAILTFVKYNPFCLITLFLYSFGLLNGHHHVQSPILSLMPLFAIMLSSSLITAGVFFIIRIKKHNKLIDLTINQETIKS